MTQVKTQKIIKIKYGVVGYAGVDVFIVVVFENLLNF